MSSRRLPQVTIVTENEFSDGAVTYSGPLVRDVLEHLALDQADTVRFTAANDYFVEIPTDDFRRFNVILAMEADGKKLSRREKGPLWLMYPISDHAELRDPIYIHRLIWQVVRIEVALKSDAADPALPRADGAARHGGLRRRSASSASGATSRTCASSARTTSSGRRPRWRSSCCASSSASPTSGSSRRPRRSRRCTNASTSSGAASSCSATAGSASSCGHYDEGHGSIAAIAAYLEELDPVVARLRARRHGDRSTRILDRAAASFQQELRLYTLRVVRADTAASALVRDRIQSSAQTTAVISLAAVLISVLSLFLILRENRRQQEIAEINRRIAEEAEQSSRAKSRFLTMMSHELRNPLNGILGPLALLGQSELAERYKRLVGQAQHSGQAMLQMLAGLLDYGEMQDGRLS